MNFEFTSWDTPERNILAELAFPYVASKARVMMGAAHIPDDVSGKLAIEAIKCATQLGLGVIILGDKIGTQDYVFNSNLNWAVNFRTQDEAGFVQEGLHGKSGLWNQNDVWLLSSKQRTWWCLNLGSINK